MVDHCEIDERCELCKYYHTLKHNFRQGVGFEESHCCTIFHDNPDGFVVEVEPGSRCEMFTRMEG